MEIATREQHHPPIGFQHLSTFKRSSSGFYWIPSIPAFIDKLFAGASFLAPISPA